MSSNMKKKIGFKEGFKLWWFQKRETLEEQEFYSKKFDFCSCYYCGNYGPCSHRCVYCGIYVDSISTHCNCSAKELRDPRRLKSPPAIPQPLIITLLPYIIISIILICISISNHNPFIDPTNLLITLQYIGVAVMCIIIFAIVLCFLAFLTDFV